MKRFQTLRLLALVLVVSVVFCSGCNGGNGDGSLPADPCAGGPVPCLTENWGDTFYVFEDDYGDPIVVMSGGVEAGVGGIYYDERGEPYPIALAGPVVDCYNSELRYGAIDWNWNGTVEEDEWLDSVEGKMNICKETLKIYDLVIEGFPMDDTEATYLDFGILTASIVIQKDRGFPTKLIHELIERVNEE